MSARSRRREDPPTFDRRPTLTAIQREQTAAELALAQAPGEALRSTSKECDSEGARFTRRVLDGLFTFAGVLERDGTLIEVNRAPLEAAGLAAEEIRGRKLWDSVFFAHSEEVRARLREACARAAGGESVRFDLDARMKGGARSVIDLQIAPLHDAEGRTTHLIASAVDVTERVRAERARIDMEAEDALRASEARAVSAAARAAAEGRLLDAVFEAAPAGIMVADAGGRIVRMNSANVRLWGPAPYPESTEDYQEWRGYWADNTDRQGRRLESGEWAMSRALRGEVVPGDVIEVEPFDAPGTRRTIVNSAAPVRDTEGRVVGAVAAQMDITDRVRAEAEVRKSEERYGLVFRATNDVIWDLDLESERLEWNEAVLQHFGSTREELGHSLDTWADRIHPEDRERVSAGLRRAVTEGAATWCAEYRFRKNDGSYAVFLDRGYVARDASGKPVRMIGSMLDVSATREADRRKDEFLAMLAHELRNPLAPIRNAVRLLEAKTAEDAEARHYLEILQRQTAQLASLVDDLLDVSRITRGMVQVKQERVDLVGAVDRALEAVQPLLDEKRHEVSVTLPRRRAYVLGDSLRLEQVLVNLVTNAAKYTDPGGQIAVRLACRDGWIDLSVQDSGIGLEPQMLAHIFNLFGQARRGLDRAQGGLGIGLTIARRLVELHGGKIEARSAGLSRGSEFIVTLPLLPADLGPSAPSPTLAARPTGGKRVLVVDDNVDSAETLALLMAHAGHEVVVAHDGPSALAKADTTRPDLVLLDIGLPGMDGYEVARRLRQNPRTRHVRMAALTGYGQAGDLERAEAAGFDQHFVKPVDFDALTAFAEAPTADGERG